MSKTHARSRVRPDHPPMTDLFRACSEVLEEELLPTHYRNLTQLALQKLNWKKLDGRSLHLLGEDVREKMLIAGQFGTFYVGKPLCFGVKRWWFLRGMELFNVGWEVPIDADLTVAAYAAADLLLRKNHMITSTGDTVRRWFAGSRGKIIEAHVSSWFKTNYTNLWLPPDNEGAYDRPCDHDFKLQFSRECCTVDVMGPRRDDLYGMPLYKSKPLSADLFIQARYGGDRSERILMEGYLVRKYKPGKNEKPINRYTTDDFISGFSPDRTNAIQTLIVKCNCARSGIDWYALRAEALRENSHE